MRFDWGSQPDEVDALRERIDTLEAEIEHLRDALWLVNGLIRGDEPVSRDAVAHIIETSLAKNRSG